MNQNLRGAFPAGPDTNVPSIPVPGPDLPTSTPEMPAGDIRPVPGNPDMPLTSPSAPTMPQPAPDEPMPGPASPTMPGQPAFA